MISFQYKKEKQNILISLKTDAVQYGTFHRIATLIYALKLDIVSGELGTVEEDGVQYTLDSFLLKSMDADPNNAAYQLAVLMDSLFKQQTAYDDILAKLQIPEPPIAMFFKENPEFIFTDLPDQAKTCFYLETSAGRGLLYYISKILMEFQIDIVSATIETDEKTERARDTFYLRDKFGKMFGGTDLASQIRLAILAPLKQTT